MSSFILFITVRLSVCCWKKRGLHWKFALFCVVLLKLTFFWTFCIGILFENASSQLCFGFLLFLQTRLDRKSGLKWSSLFLFNSAVYDCHLFLHSGVFEDTYQLTEFPDLGDWKIVVESKVCFSLVYCTNSCYCILLLMFTVYCYSRYSVLLLMLLYI